MPRRARPHHHHVYVVLLSPRVWNEPAFRQANPGHDVRKPCVYVGMTGLDPDLRFDRHMAGVQANRFVLKYGERGPANATGMGRVVARKAASKTQSGAGLHTRRAFATPRAAFLATTRREGHRRAPLRVAPLARISMRAARCALIGARRWPSRPIPVAFAGPMPQLYEVYNPMPYDAARDMEVELAIALREQGYGVWQA